MRFLNEYRKDASLELTQGRAVFYALTAYLPPIQHKIWRHLKLSVSYASDKMLSYEGVLLNRKFARTSAGHYVHTVCAILYESGLLDVWVRIDAARALSHATRRVNNQPLYEVESRSEGDRGSWPLGLNELSLPFGALTLAWLIAILIRTWVKFARRKRPQGPYYGP